MDTIRIAIADDHKLFREGIEHDFAIRSSV